jgi:hypothetical protein
MDTDELISTFKEILITPLDQLSLESQLSFQSILKQSPSPILFKLRNLLEIMKNRVLPNNYSTYLNILTSLLDSQDSLPGRISPDILEPVSDISLINTSEYFRSSEVIDISTGTSIWALYLKRQLLEKITTDQRQAKLIYSKKILVRTLSSIVKRLGFKFLSALQKYIQDLNLKMITLNNLLKNIRKVQKKAFYKLAKPIEIAKMNDNFGSRNRSKQFALIINKLGSNKIGIALRCVLSANPHPILSKIIYLFHKKVQNYFYELKLRTSFSSIKNSLSTKLHASYKLKSMLSKMLSNNLNYLFDSCIKIHKIKEKVCIHLIYYYNSKLVRVFQRFKFDFYTNDSTYIKTIRFEKSMLRVCIKYLHRYIGILFGHCNFLMKKGFDAFVHNYYQTDIEKVTTAWKWKLSNSSSKWYVESLRNSNTKKITVSLFTALINYCDKIKRFSFNTLKKQLKAFKAIKTFQKAISQSKKHVLSKWNYTTKILKEIRLMNFKLLLMVLSKK